MKDNTLLAAGNSAYGALAVDALSDRGTTTNGPTAIVGTGIAVTGMTKPTVRDNDLGLSVRPVSACPQVAFGVDADGYAAGGDFPAGATAVRFTGATGDGCIGH